MTFNKILFSFLLIFGLQLSAQDSDIFFDYEEYDWEEEQAAYTGEVDDSTAAVVLKEKLLYDYNYDEDNRLVMDRLFHRRIYINSTRALEEFNRKYIPTGEGSELLKEMIMSLTD